MCCMGKLTSDKQRDHTGNIVFRVVDIESSRITVRSKTEERASIEISHNSHTERCCGIILAPVILHNVSRIILLVCYAILIAAASYNIQNVEVDFDKMYFVSEDSEINSWFQANEKYF